MYQRQCEISEKPVSIAFNKQGNTADTARENELDEDKFDESSDEELVEDGQEDTMLLQGEIGSSATFLLGARTRLGELHVLTIVCSTEQSMGQFKGTDYADFKLLKILLLKILNEM